MAMIYVELTDDEFGVLKMIATERDRDVEAEAAACLRVALLDLDYLSYIEGLISEELQGEGWKGE